MTKTQYSMYKAMLSLDSDMPKSVRLAGEVSSRFIIGVAAILIAEKLLYVIIDLL